MRFVPPRCPNPACSQHQQPSPGFYSCQGSYRPKCRLEPVPRFRCSTCGKGFSRQTFRADYYDHRPDANVQVFQLLVSGAGLRQTARIAGLGVHALQQKFRKLCRLLRALNRNLLCQLPGSRTYLFDELETFEGLSILPLTVPVLIEKESLLIVATGAAAIRRVRKKGSERQRWLEDYERKHGKRQDFGRACVEGTFRRFRHLLAGEKATLLTDQKALYGSLCKRLFGAQVQHLAFSGKLPRTTRNPLFLINNADAVLRDLCGRLRRPSWLVSKKRKHLRLQLELFTAYRNWHRKRTNKDEHGLTPGKVLGLVQRQLEWAEMLAWRQDWRQRSIHPVSTSGHETVMQRVA